MNFAAKQIISKLLVPGILILISVLLVWLWPVIVQKASGETLKAFLKLFHILPYLIFFVGVTMGIRYSNSGLTLTTLILTLSYIAFTVYSKQAKNIAVFEAVTILLPLNIAFFSTVPKRKVFTSKTFMILLSVVIQIVLVLTVFQRKSFFYEKTRSLFGLASKELAKYFTEFSSLLSGHIVKEFIIIALAVYAVIFAFLMVRFVHKKDTTMAGYTGILVATAAAVTSRGAAPGTIIYFSFAGLILIMSAIETSYYMAYIDELTGLPGRRSLNETMNDLGKRYSIAMMDIDFFKKFNDTYGHETGDQVLKMVADKIGAVSGGSHTFRYGGEEFTAVFPGKDADEAFPFLEKLRETIEDTPFIVRNSDRDATSPGGRNKGSGSKEVVQITISIGVAEAGGPLLSPDDVIKAADQALYKAKEKGRNNVQYF